jgi:hypothetical protein
MIFLKAMILPMTESDQQRITQHKRFALRAHPNPSLTLRTSFMLETLSAIAGIPLEHLCNDYSLRRFRLY